MPAAPTVGLRYRQVLALDQMADVLEYKLYAPGVGPVLTLGVSGGVGREALVQHGRVSPRIAQLAAETPLGRPYP